MSQAGKFEFGNPVIPDVQSLTGDDGLIVVPDGAQNINVVGDVSFIETLRFDPNTLAITLINNQQVTVTTVDATPTTLGFVTLADNSAVSMIAEVIGAQDTYAQVCTGIIQYSARRAGGGAVLIGGPVYLNASDNFATADFLIDVSGNDLRLRVVGEAATTINWKANIRHIVIDV